MSESKAVFAVLAVNHPGVLLRVAGLFSRRGFNIDSIIACNTEDPTRSRLTLLVTGDEATFAQITRQLLKLEDILTVKVRAAGPARSTVLKMVQAYGARVLDIGETTVTLEMTGQTEEVDVFVDQLERYGILEMSRTGINALQRGDGTIHDEN